MNSLKYKLYLVAFILFYSCNSFAQGFSFNDSNIIFQNSNGKNLTKAEIEEIVKSPFGINKSTDPSGKKIIKLIPTTNAAHESYLKQKELFRKSLIGKPMPDFIMKSIAGKMFNKSELIGKTIVFNFWFIACEPCKREIPFLNSLVQKYKNKEVTFLGPSFDKIPELKKFLYSTSFQYQIIPDAKNYIDLLKIETFPLDIIVDKKGIIVEVIQGNNDRETEALLTKAIDKALL